MAFLSFRFQGTPPGLVRLLCGFCQRLDKTTEQARRRFFRQVFSILWFGNKIGVGWFWGKALPTYVYPDCLKEVMRTIINASLRDYPNPETSAVSFFLSCYIHTNFS